MPANRSTVRFLLFLSTIVFVSVAIWAISETTANSSVTKGTLRVIFSGGLEGNAEPCG